MATEHISIRPLSCFLQWTDQSDGKLKGHVQRCRRGTSWVGHDEIQVGGDLYTIAYSPATECEIPLDFMNSGEEMEVDGDPDRTTDGSDLYPSGVFVNWPPPNAQTQQNMPHNPEQEPHLQPNMGQGQSSYGVYATASAAQNVPSQPATETSHGGHGDQANMGQGHREPGQGQGYMPGQVPPRPGYPARFPNYPGYNVNMPPMGGHYPAPPPYSESGDAHNPDTSQAQNQEGMPAGPSAHGLRPEHFQSQPRGQYQYGQFYLAYVPYRFPAPHPGQQPYQPHARAPGHPQPFPNGQQWQQFPGQGRFPNQPQGQFPNQGQFHVQPQGEGQFHNQPQAPGQYPNQAPAYTQAQPTDSTDFSDLPPPYNSSEGVDYQCTHLKRPSSGSVESSGSSESSLIIINSRSSTPTQVKQPIDSEYTAATPVTKDSPVVETETRGRAIKDQDEYLERLRRKQLDEEANARAEPDPVYNQQEQTPEVVKTENRAIQDQVEYLERLRRKQLDEESNARTEPEIIYSRQEQTPEDIIPDIDPKDTYIEKEEITEKVEINKILVSGITPQMTEHFLFHFFESRPVQKVSDVVTVTVDEESETAIVEFESPAAVNVVLEKQRFKAMGNWSSVEAYVPQPEQIVPLTTVEVRGLPRITSTEFVRLYFESGRIGGGEVLNIQVEDDVMLVEFEEEEVASRVAEKEDLQFGGRPLAVKLHEPRRMGHSHKEAEGQDVFEEEIPAPVCTVEGIRPIKSKVQSSMEDFAGFADADSIKQEINEKGLWSGLKAIFERKQIDRKKIPLNVAVTGNSGTGKSSFINAIRGLDADDEGAAIVGKVEVAMDVIAYPHPLNDYLRFWYLPGVGRSRFPPASYLEAVGFDRYDFFLILSKDRFTEIDMWLAREIHNRHKKFFFVRTKVDAAVTNDKRAHPKTHNEALLLDMIKKDCIKHLSYPLGVEPDVFLISSLEQHKFEFRRLAEKLKLISPL